MTHPIHPLRGREFAPVEIKSTTRVEQVHYTEDDGGQRSMRRTCTSIACGKRRWVTGHLGIDTDAADDIQGRMAGLNEAIARSLGEQFCIGHSYVTPTDRLNPDHVNSWFRDVVETELAPLLEEYWFDDPDRARQERNRLLDKW